MVRLLIAAAALILLALVAAPLAPRLPAIVDACCDEQAVTPGAGRDATPDTPRDATSDDSTKDDAPKDDGTKVEPAPEPRVPGTPPTPKRANRLPAPFA